MTQARQSYGQGRWPDGTAVLGHPGLLAALVPDAEDKS